MQPVVAAREDPREGPVKASSHKSLCWKRQNQLYDGTAWDQQQPPPHTSSRLLTCRVVNPFATQLLPFVHDADGTHQIGVPVIHSNMLGALLFGLILTVCIG
eukprot:5008992-Amphidinium_carterae.1